MSRDEMHREDPPTKRTVKTAVPKTRTFVGFWRDGKGQYEVLMHSGIATLRSRRHAGLQWEEVELMETTDG